MKPERVEERFVELDGWVLEKEVPQGLIGGEEEPVAVWTALELADYLEACELVLQLGQIADRCCSCPEIDVRQRFVFVRVTTPEEGLTEEDFDFAKAVDLEIGNSQRACGLSEC